MFPMFVKLAGRRSVVVGAGRIAADKAAGLLRAGAQVTVIAPEASAAIRRQANTGKLKWQQREFRASDVRGAFLAVAATNSPEVNHSVYQACNKLGVLCNVVDDPDYCDFFYPAVVRRGALEIAISTGGASPALARRLRRELEEHFGPEYAGWLKQVARQRRAILARKLPREESSRLLHEMVSREAFEEFARGKKK